MNASIVQHQIAQLEASKAAQPDTGLAVAPGPTGGQPSTQLGSNKGASTIQLMLKPGNESVSAVLEDQYGTHKQ